MTDAAPTVSVVMATYDRSNVLALAIDSVLRQRLDDVEVLVVGDACTDDSEEVVRSIAERDPRVRWQNLDWNTGDQSTPNNIGASQARGRYLAYLNHDDLWFPDHLDRCVEHLETTGAGLAFALAAVHARAGWLVTGATPSGRYDLLGMVPASSWVLRRELVDSVGPWRPPSASRIEPSQDWLLRAHRRGIDIRSTHHLTVLAISSTSAKNTYRDRHDAEQSALAAEMRDDPTALRARIAVEMLEQYAVALGPRRITANVRTMGRDILHRASARAGVHPHATSAFLRGGRRGGWKQRVDEIRGIGREAGTT